MAETYRGSVASFRTVGLASTPHNLFSIHNTAGSGFWMAIYEIALYRDLTAAEATITPLASLSVPTALPTGGTALTESRDHEDSSRTSSASAVFLGATASDGGAATAITATAGTTPIWRAGTSRLHTAVGGVWMWKVDCLPEKCKTDPFVLAPGERLLLQYVNAGVTTDHTVIDCSYAEWNTATG